MDLWSMIPIGVHHYTILSTMVSFISLGNILWKDTTYKNLLGKESYIVISFHHLILQLSYITQAWILKFKTYAMQAKHMKCTFKCSIQVYELAPPICVHLLIDPPYNVIPFVNFSPCTIVYEFAPSILLSLTIFVNFSPPLSTISMKF